MKRKILQENTWACSSGLKLENFNSVHGLTECLSWKGHQISPLPNPSILQMRKLMCNLSKSAMELTQILQDLFYLVNTQNMVLISPKKTTGSKSKVFSDIIICLLHIKYLNFYLYSNSVLSLKFHQNFLKWYKRRENS